MRDAIDVDVGAAFVVGAARDGAVHCFGRRPFGSAHTFGRLPAGPALRVSACESSCLVLCADGSVWACGATYMCGLGDKRSGGGEQTQFARIDFGASGSASGSPSGSASGSASGSGESIRAKLISMGSRLACVVAQDNRLFVVCSQRLLSDLKRFDLGFPSSASWRHTQICIFRFIFEPLHLHAALCLSADRIVVQWGDGRSGAFGTGRRSLAHRTTPLAVDFFATRGLDIIDVRYTAQIAPNNSQSC
jgi:hypothetical protein